VWSRLQALPPYLGGKRRLLGQVFKHVPRPTETPTFVDAFLGGGSVSLFAKARGYRVVCNDIALRSQVVGEAFIANDRVTLAPADVTRLFVDDGDGDGFVEEHFAPGVVTTKHAKFLDTALRNARNAPGAKKWLLLALLLKYVLRMRPMGNFGAKTIVQQAESGKWEEMNKSYVRDMLARGVTDHPRRVAEALRRQVNLGVFSNGQLNEVHRQDVFQFLESVEGDILYLDPPYAGTSAYETALRPLDSILEGKMVQPRPSAFSGRDGLKALERLLEAGQQFPLWVLSYGNAEANLDDLVELVSRFRPVSAAEEFRYAHLTGLSAEEHREKDREFLVAARR
jgi:16S rRNA G966 N2-methylase RsmD